MKLHSPLLFLLVLLSQTILPVAADEEWKYRFFTRITNVKTGEPLAKPITAEIKIVSKIDDQTFKAVVRDNEMAFKLDARLFSEADREYLQKWNPTFAVDLRDFPIEKILEQSGYQTVDLEKRDRSFYLPVTLNGRSFKFLVDTGAMSTIIDLRTVRKLKLPTRPSNVLMSGISGIAGAANEVNYETLQIGHVPITKEDKTLFAMDLSAAADGGLEGILGFEFLEKLGGMIDYEAKRLFLKPQVSSRLTGESSQVFPGDSRPPSVLSP